MENAQPRNQAEPSALNSVYFTSNAQKLGTTSRNTCIPDVSIFNILQRQFESAGLHLYPLDGDSVLVTSDRLGMHRTLPDLRSARNYLRRIGGAV
jgi:hypothetical protein